MKIPFYKPPALRASLKAVEEVMASRQLGGDGPFSKKVENWFRGHLGAAGAFLTPSCTAAMEMGLVLLGLEPHDEVIVPSFTFTSTANVVSLLGGIPVFVDHDPLTLTLDPGAIEAALTPQTKGIIPVHYAGIAADMDPIMEIAQRHNLWVMEDAAQGMGATYKGRPLGSIGHLGAISFHETKNVVSGEGGLLAVNNPELVGLAEVVRNEGTDREAFLRGEVPHYGWVHRGSSYFMSELQAAYLAPQLEALEDITNKRRMVWEFYQQSFAELEQKGLLKRPFNPPYAFHSAHIYYILLENAHVTDQLGRALKEAGIATSSHYRPLHLSTGGINLGRALGSLPHAESDPYRLLRLPLFYDMTLEEAAFVVNQVKIFFKVQDADVA